jgi:hypothetical protein
MLYAVNMQCLGICEFDRENPVDGGVARSKHDPDMFEFEVTSSVDHRVERTDHAAYAGLRTLLLDVQTARGSLSRSPPTGSRSRTR